MRPETKALAEFLSAIDFTHFCTFTTRRPVSIPATRRIAEKVSRIVDAGRTSTMFWAAEKFDLNDGMKSTAVLRHPGDNHTDYTTSRYHFHALLKTPDFGMSADQLFKWYQPRYGRCDIINNTLPHVKESAAFYCAKYITKSLADYDMYFANQVVDDRPWIKPPDDLFLSE